MGEASVNGICVANVLIVVSAASAIVSTAKQNSIIRLGVAVWLSCKERAQIPSWRQSLAGLQQDQEMEKDGSTCSANADLWNKVWHVLGCFRMLDAVLQSTQFGALLFSIRRPSPRLGKVEISHRSPRPSRNGRWKEVGWRAEIPNLPNLMTWIHWISGWWFQIFVIFHPYLEKIPILTHIFQRGWNHQLDFFKKHGGHHSAFCCLFFWRSKTNPAVKKNFCRFIPLPWHHAAAGYGDGLEPWRFVNLPTPRKDQDVPFVDVSENSGFSPQIINFNRVFPTLQTASWMKLNCLGLRAVDTCDTLPGAGRLLCFFLCMQGLLSKTVNPEV